MNEIRRGIFEIFEAKNSKYVPVKNFPLKKIKQILVEEFVKKTK
jgi:hypothetical protein